MLATLDDLLMNLKIAEETWSVGGEMRFHLEASFRLSADASLAQEAITHFLPKLAHLAEGRSRRHGAEISSGTYRKQDRSDYRER